MNILLEKIKFPLAMAAFGIVLFCTGLEIASRQKNKMENELRAFTYPAWNKAHPGIQLSYEEWRVLHRRSLLPR